ncbi:SAND domain protein [Ostertagia ostertagi]
MTFQVKCGSLVAKMHVELFLCPGIHQPCIEFEKEMITPKEFTVRANKDKQKDWKGSIRIGKSNLRSLMEMHSFDFFNHSHFCSAKCQSRNYITPKARDSDKGRRRSSTSQAETNTVQISELFSSRLFASTGCRLEPISFWNEMNKFGLLDQLVDQLLECLSNVKCAAKTGGLAWAAPALTRVVSVLNMGDQLVNSINSKPIGESHLSKPRLSMDSVYNGNRKRSLDESSQSSLSRYSPDVKRPRVQYPTSVMTALDMDPRVLQALAQAQLRLSHETERTFMQSMMPLTIPGALPTPTFD